MAYSKMTKKYSLMNDEVVRALLKNSSVAKKFVSRIVSEIINIPFEDIYNDMKYINDDRLSSAKVIDAETDVMVETPNLFINLEICYTKGPTRNRQLDTYNYELYLNQASTTNDYKDMKQIIQIAIENYDFFKRGQFLYKVVSMEENLHILENDFITKYHLNIDLLKKVSYNSIKEEKDTLKKMMYMFVCEEEYLDKAYEGDDFMESVVDEVRGIAGKKKIPLYLSEERIRELDREYAINEGRAEGRDLGRAEGIEQTRTDVVINMYKKNIDSKTISEVVELSVEKVESIIKDYQGSQNKE